MNPDKNSDVARSRRRLAAATQALHDGVVGFEFFEKRTEEREFREAGAVVIELKIKKLSLLAKALRAVKPDPNYRDERQTAEVLVHNPMKRSVIVHIRDEVMERKVKLAPGESTSVFTTGATSMKTSFGHVTVNLHPLSLTELAGGFSKKKQSLGRWVADFKRAFPPRT